MAFAADHGKPLNQHREVPIPPKSAATSLSVHVANHGSRCIQYDHDRIGLQLAVIRTRLVGMLTQLKRVEIVGEATDAVEDLNLIRAERPDVVILDVRMDERSGIGLLEDLKFDGSIPIIILLTNYPYVAYRQRCMQLGAHYFFDKTTEFARVAEVMQELGGHRCSPQVRIGCRLLGGSCSS